MNLPHIEPLLFAKQIFDLYNNTATVLCEFNQIPTLSMFIEAAAQASSAFDLNKDNEPKIGFLTLAKNIELLNEIKDNSYLIKLKNEVEVNNMKQFSFEAYDKNNIKIVKGLFTILVQE